MTWSIATWAGIGSCCPGWRSGEKLATFSAPEKLHGARIRQSVAGRGNLKRLYDDAAPRVFTRPENRYRIDRPVQAPPHAGQKGLASHQSQRGPVWQGKRPVSAAVVMSPQMPAKRVAVAWFVARSMLRVTFPLPM